MVGAAGAALPKVAGGIGVSLSAPSGVVTQTCAVTGARPADADAPAARVVARVVARSAALGCEGFGQEGADGGERALVGEPVVGHAGHRAGYGVLVGEAVLGPA